jgi:hypothetical protein
MSESNFTKLAAIDVGAKLEKKNGLSYLSWAWAVDQLLRADSSASWSYGDPVRWGETVMVFCTVTAFGKAMTAQLPVMDHRNKAIQNPDAFSVNTAMQRCLVKAIALHGLGLYIYAGEDIPEPDPNVRQSRSDGLTWERVDELENMAADMLSLMDEGRESEAVRGYYSLPSNEEKLCLWGFLKGPGGGSTPESRLRALIKANRPAEVTA